MDVGVPGGERGNVQTGGENRVSTISLLGCSTSVALATGLTDEEEYLTVLTVMHTKANIHSQSYLAPFFLE